MTLKSKWTTGIIASLGLLLIIGCADSQNSPAASEFTTAGSTSEVTQSRGNTLVLGDTDEDNPAQKIKRFTPLADYLAANLSGVGIDYGEVIIARNVDEMARLLDEGVVDVYFDSSYPSLRVQELSGSSVISRRWKQGEPNYWSTFITLADSGIAKPEDFAGKVIAFEDSSSTSGFVLPAGTLIERGLTLKLVSNPRAPVGPDEVGYFFAGDEQNTFELILQKKVAGGGVSNQDYNDLPAALKNQIIQIERTIAVPRQLVSVRRGLDPELTQQLFDLLISLEDTDVGLQILADLKNTAQFDALPPESTRALDRLKVFIGLVIR